MKVTSIVRECAMRAITAPREPLQSCRVLMIQEMMLDVATTIAATQPEIVATQTKPTGARAARSRAYR